MIEYEDVTKRRNEDCGRNIHSHSFIHPFANLSRETVCFLQTKNLFICSVINHPSLKDGDRIYLYTLCVFFLSSSFTDWSENVRSENCLQEREKSEFVCVRETEMKMMDVQEELEEKSGRPRNRNARTMFDFFRVYRQKKKQKTIFLYYWSTQKGRERNDLN